MHLQVVVNVNTSGHGVHFRRAGPRDKVPQLSTPLFHRSF